MKQKRLFKDLLVLLVLTFIVLFFLNYKEYSKIKKIEFESSKIKFKENSVKRKYGIVESDILRWRKTIDDMFELRKYLYSKKEIPLLRFEIEKLLFSSSIMPKEESVSIRKFSSLYGEVVIKFKASISDTMLYSLSKKIKEFPKLIYIKSLRTTNSGGVEIEIGGVYFEK